MFGVWTMKCLYLLQALGSQVTPMPQRRQVPLWHSAYNKQKRWFPQHSTKRHLSTSEQLLACGSSGTAGPVPFSCSTAPGMAMDVQWGALGTVLGHTARPHCAQIPSCAADLLEPWVTWTCLLLPHSLQSSIISCIHMQHRDTRRSAVPKDTDSWTSPQLRDAQRSPQSGIRTNPGFLSPNMLQLPTEGHQRLR